MFGQHQEQLYTGYVSHGQSTKENFHLIVSIEENLVKSLFTEVHVDRMKGAKRLMETAPN